MTMPMATMASNKDAALARYRYDAEGLLAVVQGADSTRQRYWLEDEPVAEFATLASGEPDHRCWLWMAGTPIAQRGAAASSPALLLASDAAHSPLLEAGDAPHSIAYAPHGHRTCTAPAGAVAHSWIGFNGELLDPDMGFQLLGPRHHRPYSPTLGIFLAPDPLSPFNEGGLNGLAYCEGDPINRTDPTGGFWKWIMAGIAVVVAVASFGAMAVVGVTASAVIGATISSMAAAVEVTASVVEDEKMKEVLGYVGIGLTVAGAVTALPAVAKAGTQLASKARQFVQRLGTARPQSFVDKGTRTVLKAWPLGAPSSGSQASVASSRSASRASLAKMIDNRIGAATVDSDEFIDVVQAHGARFLTGADGNVSGGKLASQIRAKFGQDHVFRRIELQSCRSAFGGRYASQAQRVADKLGVPTTGFQGKAEFTPSMNRAHNLGNRKIMQPQTGWAKRRTAILNGTLSRLVGLRYRLTSI
ncbi:RHS repeat-associated core domain-containing protein [Stenotrophomonas bentonitica]